MPKGNSPYKKGRSLEWRAKRQLQTEGYVVIRSAGSKGPVDLVAFNRSSVRLIQVVKGRIPSSKLQALKRLPVPKGCRLEVWVARQGKGFVWDKRIVRAL